MNTYFLSDKLNDKENQDAPKMVQERFTLHQLVLVYVNVWTNALKVTDTSVRILDKRLFGIGWNALLD